MIAYLVVAGICVDKGHFAARNRRAAARNLHLKRSGQWQDELGENMVIHAALSVVAAHGQRE
ncbi:hypothetical protein [Sphingomonas colocasiae]|uniref:hypothetical protein n=1 Tax=Sphingomonas colocasiae TaxID=1848973 RepID=UPI001FE44911|nr:hypothetical protein [Sphingomonas colocasiae]